MTVKKWWKQFSVIVFGILLTSCANANVKSESRRVSSVVEASLPFAHAELSLSQVVAGTVALVTVKVSDKTKPGDLSGEFEGTELPFFSAEEAGVLQALLPVPYERRPGPATLKIKVHKGEGKEELLLPFTVSEGNYPSEKLKVDRAKVIPRGKKTLERIFREKVKVGEIYKRVTLQKYWTGPFHLPIESPVTSVFGTRRVYNGVHKGFHPGLDLKAPSGTPVLAPAGGVVVMAKNLFFTGNTVILDHGYGVISLYAHLSSMNVRPEQVLKPGELVGLSGKTGRVSGPHLHWQTVVHKVKVDPMSLLRVFQ